MTNLEIILEQITESCKMCSECDPCCTGNILKKCIASNRFALDSLITITL